MASFWTARRGLVGFRPVLVSSTLVLAACGSSSAPGETPDASSGHDAKAALDGRTLDARGDAIRHDTGATDVIDAPSSDAPDVGTAPDAGACAMVPPGATALGFTTRVFCLEPTTADISYSSTPVTNLYSGMYYDATPPDATHYTMLDGELAIGLGGGVTTQRPNSTQGRLPYLLAGKGFYAEFAVTLSDNNADHWPAVWLMPQEHDLAQDDHASTDPAGFERWMEIDCDEGGFYSGSLHSLINWQGTYPHYTPTTYNNYGQPPLNLDRTVEHVFGVSYDPVGQAVQYWLDGTMAYSHSTSTIPTVVNGYHYYLIMNAATHGMNLPYEMRLRYASAWSK